jgi:hypothetical protein
MENLEARLAEVERKVDNLVSVCQAVADDTLRICFILDELYRVGAVPTPPWNVATAMVELHHAQQAQKSGDTDAGGMPIAERIAELKQEILFLREDYHRSVIASGESHETQPTE